jgi:hypothetical protein
LDTSEKKVQQVLAEKHNKMVEIVIVERTNIELSEKIKELNGIIDKFE